MGSGGGAAIWGMTTDLSLEFNVAISSSCFSKALMVCANLMIPGNNKITLQTANSGLDYEAELSKCTSTSVRKFVRVFCHTTYRLAQTSWKKSPVCFLLLFDQNNDVVLSPCSENNSFCSTKQEISRNFQTPNFCLQKAKATRGLWRQCTFCWNFCLTWLK